MSEKKPQNARDLFSHLCQDYWRALLRLQELRIVFGNRDDVALLNALTGGPFMYDMQRAFGQDLLLRLCRLNDDAETSGHRNWSLAALAKCMENEGFKSHADLDTLVKAAKKRSSFARPWRNKVFAHSDASLARDQEEGRTLPDATLRKVDFALAAVATALERAAEQLDEAAPGREVAAMRAGQFVHRARCVAKAAKFMDGVIAREGNTAFDDQGAASAFLQKIGRKPTQEQVAHVVALREVATWFNT